MKLRYFGLHATMEKKLTENIFIAFDDLVI